jgi:hypothetical protein
MAARLTELYPKGSRVEIFWQDAWCEGVVITHTPPAVWVQLKWGERLFVTNHSRIRMQVDDET